MANINIGRVRPSFQGNWGSTTQYRSLNIVRYNGSAWFALQDSLNQVPAEGSSFWGLMVSDGIRPDSNINYVEFSTTALRNSSTTTAWSSGDIAAVGTDPNFQYFVYVGDVQTTAAATMDSDWTQLGGSGVTVNGASAVAATPVLSVLEVDNTDYRVGAYFQAAAPTGTAATSYGNLWVRSTDGSLFIFNGSAWVQIN